LPLCSPDIITLANENITSISFFYVGEDLSDNPNLLEEIPEISDGETERN
jgi:hypothetical protein